jgi:hypothetical protein
MICNREANQWHWHQGLVGIKSIRTVVLPTKIKGGPLYGKNHHSHEDRIFSCLEVWKWSHGRRGVQEADVHQGGHCQRPSHPGCEAKRDAAGRPVPIQLTRAHGQAHRRHAPFPEEGQVAIGNEVRHPDHSTRTSARQEDRTDAYRRGAG